MTLSPDEQRQLRALTKKAAAGRKQKREIRGKALGLKAPDKARGRVREPLYRAWLRGLPCIAGLIEGGCSGRMEAAHQKLAIAGKWTEGGGGLRTDDDRCIGLCRWHHQDAPNACDKAQRRFWDRLGIGSRIADLCGELWAAFQKGEDGAAILQGYAAEVQP